MSNIASLNHLSLENSWLAIGVFDGMHLGHQSMLRRLVEGAHAVQAPAVVMTFEPHPAIVLGNQSDFKWLSPPEERSSLINALGVDHILLQQFDRNFASIHADDFMQGVTRQLGLRNLLVGYDFALGKDRQGNADYLEKLGKQLGYHLEVFPPIRDEIGIISSTRIRSLVRAGNIDQVPALLGRYYSLEGYVVHCDGRGRTIDIPTANLDLPEEKLIPVNGVYACLAWLGGACFPAVTNIGTRPTFTSGDQAAHVETHLLDFREEIYGRELKLEFISRLRDEKRFDSVESLVTQIQADIRQARTILKDFNR